jgi:hypothetical protein
MERLHTALCSAFDQESLDQMLRFRLNINRTHVVGTGTFREVVFRLIEKAVSEGWVVELVRNAHEYVPGNLVLKQYYTDYVNRSAPGAPNVKPKVVLAQVVEPPTSPGWRSHIQPPSAGTWVAIILGIILGMVAGGGVGYLIGILIGRPVEATVIGMIIGTMPVLGAVVVRPR